MYEAKCLVMDYPHHVTQQHHQAPQHHIHQLHQLTTPDTTQSRWTQYQQLWRQHHMFNNFNNNNGMLPNIIFICLEVAGTAKRLIRSVPAQRFSRGLREGIGMEKGPFKKSAKMKKLRLIPCKEY